LAFCHFPVFLKRSEAILEKRQSEIDMRKESKSVLRTIDRIQRSMKRKLGAQMISMSFAPILMVKDAGRPANWVCTF
jgi:hypothetical protein